MEDLEYITKDAVMLCDQGAAPDFFKPTFNTKTKIHGCLVATKVDFVPLTNIPSFRICLITQKPCVPATAPWSNTFQLKVNNEETLLGRSKCKCSVGGTIEFLTSGQTPLSDEMKKEMKDLQDQADNAVEESGNDSVGEAGFIEGMIPIWGSGRDMVNAIQTGDTFGAVLNAGFLVWDVASVVAGVFSFGSGTAAMQGAKAGLKASVKAGAKTIARKATALLGKAGLNSLTKQGVKSYLKNIACKVVKALCFTGDTLVHVQDGTKQIRDIEIGDWVYSYDTEENKILLKQVVSVHEDQADEILEIETRNGIIETTRDHPFFVDGRFKDAEQINIGDKLLTVSGELVEVISLNYVSRQETVYSFEVEGSHNYFVGVDGVLVLNACRSNYRQFFLNAYKKAAKMAKKLKIEVHHRIPQEWFKKGVFKGDANTLSNLVDLEKKFHKTISDEWTLFRKHYKDIEKRLPTQAEVYKKAKELDKLIEKHLRKRGY